VERKKNSMLFFEFEEIDPAFIDFIKDKFMDYDGVKHTDFFVYKGK